MNNKVYINAYVSVSFLYNNQCYFLNFYHDLSMKGKNIDEFDAKLLVSFVLSYYNVPSKEVSVDKVNICREINQKWETIYNAEKLQFYHQGKQ